LHRVTQLVTIIDLTLSVEKLEMSVDVVTLKEISVHVFGKTCYNLFMKLIILHFE
jgi:hypothetical protein